MSDIKPALTAQEWADICVEGDCRADELWSRLRDWQSFPEQSESEIDFHAIAAISLSGQPFGFTRDHLDKLRLLIDKAGSFQDAGPWGEGWQSAELEAAIKAAGEIADRIEALLPPE